MNSLRTNGRKPNSFLTIYSNFHGDKYGASIKISYEEGTESMVISYIGVPDEKRRQGIGGKVVAELCEYADNHKLPIRLYANGDFGTDLSVLIKFYEKFGFANQNRFAKGVGHLMIRRP